jgi:hypothetical protein
MFSNVSASGLRVSLYAIASSSDMRAMGSVGTGSGSSVAPMNTASWMHAPRSSCDAVHSGAAHEARYCRTPTTTAAQARSSCADARAHQAHRTTHTTTGTRISVPSFEERIEPSASHPQSYKRPQEIPSMHSKHVGEEREKRQRNRGLTPQHNDARSTPTGDKNAQDGIPALTQTQKGRGTPWTPAIPCAKANKRPQPSGCSPDCDSRSGAVCTGRYEQRQSVAIGINRVLHYHERHRPAHCSHCCRFFTQAAPRRSRPRTHPCSSPVPRTCRPAACGTQPAPRCPCRRR